MKLPRAIAALGMALALSFGLMLAPSQAEAATVTINPRANAVEAGQILAAPDGSVFTITVYDAGLSAGQKDVTHTFQTGDTLRQTANKIVQAINADTDLQAIGVTATLGTGANYTIQSTSANSTFYKQTTTGGGSNRLAIQETLTVGGTVTVDDKLTLTIYDAGLVGGKEAVVYKPNAGDTIADIVIRLRNKINNSTTLSALDITAKVSPTDSSVLLITSPTFDSTEKVTSYTAVVKAGGTETMSLGGSWGTNSGQTISVTGSVTVGETVKFTVFDLGLPDFQKEVSYVVQSDDNLNKIRCGLRTEVNNDPDLAEIGVRATCAGGVLSLTSKSPEVTSYWLDRVIVCIPIVSSPSVWPPAARAKYCNDASITNALRVRSTLEQLGIPNNNGDVHSAASGYLTGGNSKFTVYVYSDHDHFYDSAESLPNKLTGGPTQDKVAGVSASWTVIPVRTQILGWSTNNDLSLIFETGKDRAAPGNFALNNSIQNATAHEMGHQFSALAGSGGQRLDQSSGFQTAWNLDLQGLGLASPCRYDAPIPNTDPQQYVQKDGIFTGALGANGNYICGADGYGYGGGSAVSTVTLHYPYFAQFANKPLSDMPKEEVFAKEFAFRAGFPDTKASDGSDIPGNDLLFQGSQALVCTQTYVNIWAQFGRNPTIDELRSAGYPYPLGTKTGFLNCAGEVFEEDNAGS